MTDQTDIARLTEKIAELHERDAVQEERMNTRQAETEGALDRLRADMAQRDASRDAAAAQRDVDAAKRDNRLMLVIVGTIVGAASLATAVLGVIITAA